jgi:hypothetical protein
LANSLRHAAECYSESPPMTSEAAAAAG